MLPINFTFTFTDPVEELLLTVGDDTFIFTASFREAAEPGCSVQLREGFMHIGYSKLHGYVFYIIAKLPSRIQQKTFCSWRPLTVKHPQCANERKKISSSYSIILSQLFVTCSSNYLPFPSWIQWRNSYQ